MTILEGLDGLRRVPPGGVISVGNFDGVHRGHAEILSRGARAAGPDARRDAGRCHVRAAPADGPPPRRRPAPIVFPNPEARADRGGRGGRAGRAAADPRSAEPGGRGFLGDPARRGPPGAHGGRRELQLRPRPAGDHRAAARMERGDGRATARRAAPCRSPAGHAADAGEQLAHPLAARERTRPRRGDLPRAGVHARRRGRSRVTSAAGRSACRRPTSTAASR